jgi:acetolactate synthase regulatory subunit
MNSPHLALTFHVAKDCTLDTLEGVLAIARRGGLNLAGLQLRSCDGNDAISLDLFHEEADRLDLFFARLNNVWGVHSVEKLYSQYAEAELV